MIFCMSKKSQYHRRNMRIQEKAFWFYSLLLFITSKLHGKFIKKRSCRDLKLHYKFHHKVNLIRDYREIYGPYSLLINASYCIFCSHPHKHIRQIWKKKFFAWASMWSILKILMKHAVTVGALNFSGKITLSRGR